MAISSASTSVIAAFREHLVDADISATLLFLNMEEDRIGRVLVPVTEFEGDAATGDIYASNHLIATHPGRDPRPPRGLARDHRLHARQQGRDSEDRGTVTGFTPTVMAWKYDLTIGMFKKDCRFDPEGIATLKRAFMDQKLLSTPLDMAKLSRSLPAEVTPRPEAGWRRCPTARRNCGRLTPPFPCRKLLPFPRGAPARG